MCLFVSPSLLECRQKPLFPSSYIEKLIWHVWRQEGEWANDKSEANHGGMITWLKKDKSTKWFDDRRNFANNLLLSNWTRYSSSSSSSRLEILLPIPLSIRVSPKLWIIIVQLQPGASMEHPRLLSPEHPRLLPRLLPASPPLNMLSSSIWNLDGV